MNFLLMDVPVITEIKKVNGTKTAYFLPEKQLPTFIYNFLFIHTHKVKKTIETGKYLASVELVYNMVEGMFILTDISFKEKYEK